MITGFHTIIYSSDAAATRAFFRDVLGWNSVDAGDDWLIFRTPPAELGVHPTEGPDGEPWGTANTHQCSLMCDDIEAAVVALRDKGISVDDEIHDEGFGLTTGVEVPGVGPIMLYQPRHPVAYNLEPR